MRGALREASSRYRRLLYAAGRIEPYKSPEVLTDEIASSKPISK